jgi:hypothetical protein
MPKRKSSYKPTGRPMGRPKGARGLATIERERVAAEIAQRTVMEAQTEGKKLGKDVIEEYMLLFRGMSAVFQPTPADLEAGRPVENQHANEEKFVHYARLACGQAGELAKYQSPTYKSIPIPDPYVSRKIKTIDQYGNNAIDMKDPNVVARIYRSMMTADD